MKLVSYRPSARSHRTCLGMLVEREGKPFVLDLARAIAWAFPGSQIGPVPCDMICFIRSGSKGLSQARRVIGAALSRWRDLPLGVATPLEKVRLVAPVQHPGKIICPGMNFRQHLLEVSGPNAPMPEMPLGFLKTASCVVGPEHPIRRPSWTQKLDYEVEMAAVIGVGGVNIPRERALEHVFGYTILNDVSARETQLAEMKKGFLALGKNFPASAPMGPYLLTADELPNPHTLSMELCVNGQLRQKGHTSDLIYDWPALIAYWSRTGLEPGDVITTGTPSGVALGKEPDTSWYLKPGDVVEATVERLGTLRNPIV